MMELVREKQINKGHILLKIMKKIEKIYDPKFNIWNDYTLDDEYSFENKSKILP